MFHSSFTVLELENVEKKSKNVQDETRVVEDIQGDHWNVVGWPNVVERWSFHGKTDADSRHDSAIRSLHPLGVLPFENPVHLKSSDRLPTMEYNPKKTKTKQKNRNTF